MIKEISLSLSSGGSFGGNIANELKAKYPFIQSNRIKYLRFQLVSVTGDGNIVRIGNVVGEGSIEITLNDPIFVLQGFGRERLLDHFKFMKAINGTTGFTTVSVFIIQED